MQQLQGANYFPPPPNESYSCKTCLYALRLDGPSEDTDSGEALPIPSQSRVHPEDENEEPVVTAITRKLFDYNHQSFSSHDPSESSRDVEHQGTVEVFDYNHQSGAKPLVSHDQLNRPASDTHESWEKGSRDQMDIPREPWEQQGSRDLLDRLPPREPWEQGARSQMDRPLEPWEPQGPRDQVDRPMELWEQQGPRDHPLEPWERQMDRPLGPWERQGPHDHMDRPIDRPVIRERRRWDQGSHDQFDHPQPHGPGQWEVPPLPPLPLPGAPLDQWGPHEAWEHGPPPHPGPPPMHRATHPSDMWEPQPPFPPGPPGPHGMGQWDGRGPPPGLPPDPNWCPPPPRPPPPPSIPYFDLPGGIMVALVPVSVSSYHTHTIKVK